jgi:methionyl-tRNA formyltransferase
MRVVFMGSPDFAVPALEALIAHHEVAVVVTQPDKPAGRGKKLSPPAVKPVAEAAGIPVVQPRSARTPELAAEMRATGAELAVVVAYGKILPTAVLEAFPRGCINIHASLLPRHRGAAPIQWAIIGGDRETGVSIMQLDEGMDTGPVLIERRTPIGDAETAGELFERLAPMGADAMLEAIAGLEAGTLEATPQDDAGATHAPMLKKTDGAVDWTRPAREVSCLIRGVDPWPGAYTELGGERIKLYGAREAEGSGAPGEVLAVDDRGVVVACGDGACAIAELQAAGRKRMSARAYAAGRQLAPGTVLG